MMTRLADHDGPEQDAAWWAVQLASDYADDALRKAADAWVAADPRRAGALLRARAALHLAGAPAGSGPEAEPVTPLPDARAGRAASQRRWISRASLATGAGLALAASLAVLALVQPRTPDFTSEIGEVRQVALKDGSHVVLNSEAALELRFATEERRVVLLRSEAHFEVAHQADRPFVVVAGPVTVTAIGTAFTVRHTPPDVQVLVSEGSVEVRGERGDPVVLRAGEKGAFSSGQAPVIAAIPADAIARSLAWRAGRLEFEGEPLDMAVNEINRYNRKKIVLANPALGREPIFGSFRSNDPKGFATAIAATLNQRIAERGDEIVVGTP